MPIPYTDRGNPQTLNAYAYGANNPLSNTDADGHDVSICPAGATQVTSACQTMSNPQYQAALNSNGSLNLPSLATLQQNRSGDITGSDVGVAATAIYTPGKDSCRIVTVPLWRCVRWLRSEAPSVAHEHHRWVWNPATFQGVASETIDVLGLHGPKEGFSAHTNSTKFRCVHLGQLFVQTERFSIAYTLCHLFLA
jgi:hypothetical protein